jgi:DHA1 family tetracycline resistance protein-like MFS transporter
MTNAHALNSTSAPASSRHALLILFLTVFIDLLGFGIVIPFLPLFAARMHIHATGIGLVLASYSLMQFLLAPALGRLSDRIGRRPIIMLGLLGSGLGYLLYGFATTFAGLLLSRVVHGGCAATISTAQAFVADTTPPGKRAHAMGMIGAAFGLGFVLGPAVGGLLGHYGLRVPVFFAAALSFANFGFAAWRLPESHREADPTVARASLIGTLSEPWRRLPKLVTGRGPGLMFGQAFLLTSAFAVLETTFALLAARRFGYRAGAIGGLFAYAGLLQALTQGYLVGRLNRRLGEEQLIGAGALLMGLGMAILGLTGSTLLLFIALALTALGYGLSSPAIASLLSKRTETAAQGQVLGLNQSALSLARIFGPVVGGSLFQLAAGPGAYLGAAALSLGALALVRALPTHPIQSGGGN